MDGKKTGVHAKRAPRTGSKKVFKGIKMDAQLVAEFERRAAAEGVSFSRYIVEHCIEPNSENTTPSNE